MRLTAFAQGVRKEYFASLWTETLAVIEPAVRTTMERRQIDKALRKIEQSVLDGVRHGHFAIRIECVTVQHGVRRLVLTYGKEYKFDIPEDELDPRLKDEREHGD